MASMNFDFANDRSDCVVEQTMEIHNGRLEVTLKFRKDFDGIYAAGKVIQGTGSDAGDAFSNKHWAYTMIRGDAGDQLRVAVNFNPYPSDCFVAGGAFNQPADVPVRSEKFCIVATTVYGDPDHPQVRKLREYRDNVLLENSAGRVFVAAYYRYGEWFAVIPRKCALAGLLSRAFSIVFRTSRLAV